MSWSCLKMFITLTQISSLTRWDQSKVTSSTKNLEDMSLIGVELIKWEISASSCHLLFVFGHISPLSPQKSWLTPRLCLQNLQGPEITRNSCHSLQVPGATVIEYGSTIWWAPLQLGHHRLLEKIQVRFERMLGDRLGYSYFGVLVAELQRSRGCLDWNHINWGRQGVTLCICSRLSMVS